MNECIIYNSVEKSLNGNELYILCIYIRDKENTKYAYDYELYKYYWPSSLGPTGCWPRRRRSCRDMCFVEIAGRARDEWREHNYYYHRYSRCSITERVYYNIPIYRCY